MPYLILIFTTSLWGGCYYCSHFAEEETKVQRVKLQDTVSVRVLDSRTMALTVVSGRWCFLLNTNRSDRTTVTPATRGNTPEERGATQLGWNSGWGWAGKGSGIRPPGLESQIGHSLAAWLWASPSISWCLSFLVSKSGRLVFFISLGLLWELNELIHIHIQNASNSA